MESPHQRWARGRRELLATQIINRQSWRSQRAKEPLYQSQRWLEDHGYTPGCDGCAARSARAARHWTECGRVAGKLKQEVANTPTGRPRLWAEPQNDPTGPPQEESPADGNNDVTGKERSGGPAEPAQSTGEEMRASKRRSRLRGSELPATQVRRLELIQLEEMEVLREETLGTIGAPA